MLKITTTKKPLSDVLPKYTRLVFTDQASSWHRLVENSDKTTELRFGRGTKWKLATAHAYTRDLQTLIRSIVQVAKSYEIEHLAIDVHPEQFATNDTAWFYSTLTENLLLASYEYTTYKSKVEKKKSLTEVLVCHVDGKEALAGIKHGETVATYVNKARDIANTPGCDMTPTDLGRSAQALAKGLPVSVKVLGESELKKLKMGALLAVGQGTKSETKFIVAEYYGAGKPTGTKVDKKKQPIVLIGKGVTYDTGGLNVKPAGSMHDMHLDMSGGSSVLATIMCLAKLGVKQNIIALVPSAENAISDTAMRAGDIVTSMSGTTIEVLHTDAEGRMILADALTYSARYYPKTIIDVATLTGAALVALGQYASAVMTKDYNLSAELMEAGVASGDFLWPLPLWDEYKTALKSNRADISNIATNFAKYGGAIEGGTFLSHFAPKDVPFAHIDIAPRMDSVPADKLAKGSTGEPVRLLVRYIEQL